jgi:diguanylate cyclase (GGDEF)-like protein
MEKKKIEQKELEREKQCITNELNKNFFSLSFPEQIEAKFSNYYFNRMKEIMNQSIILGVFIYLLFGILDILIYSDYLRKLFFVRYIVVTPVLLIGVYFLLNVKKERDIQLLFSLVLLIAGISIIVMILIVHDPTHRYYSGLTVVLLFAYVAVGLRFKFALFVGWSFIVLYYLAAIIIYHPIDNFLISNTFSLIFFNIIGMISSFFFEKHQRKLFLLSALVEIESKELEISNDRLKKLSRVDPLTNLANRRHFNGFFKKEWLRAMRYNIPISLIMIDVDFFKTFNDILGHQKGDEILTKISIIFNNCTRRAGDLASRYGGEEFLLVFYDTPLEQAVKIAENIREKILKLKIPFPGTESGETLTISLGVATVIPNKNSSCESLISAADDALYMAKRKGKNRVESILL